MKNQALSVFAILILLVTVGLAQEPDDLDALDQKFSDILKRRYRAGNMNVSNL